MSARFARLESMIEINGYREILERLDKAYPNKELLTDKEVAQFLGCSVTSSRKYLPRTPLGTSKFAVAKFITEGRKE